MHASPKGKNIIVRETVTREERVVKTGVGVWWGQSRGTRGGGGGRAGSGWGAR